MKKNKYRLLAIILLVAVTWCVPVMAENDVPNESNTTTSIVSTAPAESGVTIITPEKLDEKVSVMESELLKGLAPIMRLMSKLALVLVGFLLLAAIFVRDLFSKVFVWVGCIIVGLLIFGNVGPITDTVLYIGQWLAK